MVVLVCDDTDTAPAYFSEAVGHEVDGKRLRIVKAPQAGAAGDQIIEAAKNELASLSPEDGDEFWALIDLEMAIDSQSLIQQYRDKASKAGIKLALSQPCFEVWILAHFESTGQHFAGCKAVLELVKQRWKKAFGQDFPVRKAQADYRKLADRLDDAVQNARKQLPPNSQSWTDVWKVFARD